MTRTALALILCLASGFGLAQEQNQAPTEQPAAQAEYDTSKAGKPFYVRDTLYVPLRSGESSSYRVIHRGLKSGTKVTLVKSNADSGYSLVKTSKGAEGWIPTQYLIEEPTANIKLAQAEATIQKLTSKAGPLSEQLLEAQKDNQELEQRLKNLQQENNRLDRELQHLKSLSANAVQLDSDNKQLLNNNEQLKNTHDMLRAENDRLQSKLKSDDFINGALVLFAGMILTLFIQYFASSRKKSEWR